MNLFYRNETGKKMNFELGGVKYIIPSGSLVEIPEKYDYAVSLMQIELTPALEESIALDMEKNPEEWKEIPIEETIKQADIIFQVEAEKEKPKKTSGRKKK